MKKLLIALLCLSITGAAEAQTKTASAKKSGSATAAKAPAKKSGPMFEFRGGDVHDFGEVPEGPAAEYVFEFKNVGNEPLIIQNANASCGCTTPEWPKEPILPGKTGKIKVSFNTAGRGGQPFDKSIFLTSNAVSDKERYELHIKGTVKAKPAAPGAK